MAAGSIHAPRNHTRSIMLLAMIASAFAGNFHINLDPSIVVSSDGANNVWAYTWETYAPVSPNLNIHILGTYYGTQSEMSGLKGYISPSPNGHPGISLIYGAVQAASGAYPYKRQVGFTITSAQSSDLSGETGWFCSTPQSVIDDYFDCYAIAVVPVVNFFIDMTP